MKKALIPVAVVILLLIVIVVDAQRRSAQKELKQLSVKLEQLQGGNTKENQQRANEVVLKVKKLMDLDLSVEPTVATIVDVKKLREKNSFYDKAKNGDFLIVTPTRAILYDAAANKILDVVPVQLEQTSSQGSSKAAVTSSVKSSAKSSVKALSSAAASSAR